MRNIGNLGALVNKFRLSGVDLQDDSSSGVATVVRLAVVLQRDPLALVEVRAALDDDAVVRVPAHQGPAGGHPLAHGPNTVHFGRARGTPGTLRA